MGDEEVKERREKEEGGKKKKALPEMISCDMCGERYHIECAGVNIIEVTRDDWFCYKCSDKAALARELNKEKSHKILLSDQRYK